MRLRLRDVAQPAERQLARGRRIHAARDELARAHLDVQRELFVDLLLERHAPQPRTEGALHVANRTFETPAENRRQVASLGGELLAARVGEAVQLGAPAELGRAPLGLDPAPPLEAVEGRIERAVFDQHGVAGRLLDEAGDGVAVARTSALTS